MPSKTGGWLHAIMSHIQPFTQFPPSNASPRGAQEHNKNELTCTKMFLSWFRVDIEPPKQMGVTFRKHTNSIPACWHSLLTRRPSTFEVCWGTIRDVSKKGDSAESHPHESYIFDWSLSHALSTLNGAQTEPMCQYLVTLSVSLGSRCQVRRAPIQTIGQICQGCFK